VERAVARLNGWRKSKWNNCAILPHGVPVPRELEGKFLHLLECIQPCGKLRYEAFVRCFEGVLDGS
jgi:hypothetical protein